MAVTGSGQTLAERRMIGTPRDRPRSTPPGPPPRRLEHLRTGLRERLFAVTSASRRERVNTTVGDRRSPTVSTTTSMRGQR